MSTIQVTNINDLSDNAALVTQNGGIKTDKLTGSTSSASIVVTASGSVTTNLQKGLIKAYAYVSGNSSLGNNMNISSYADNGTGLNQLNLANPLDDSTEPFIGVGIGSPNTSVVTYEVDSATTASALKWGLTLSSNSDNLVDGTTYTLAGGDLA